MREAKIARKARLAELIKRFRLANPDPRCELYYETPFQLLLSVVLSAQTTDKAVNAVMTPLYKGGFGPVDLVRMGKDAFLQKIKTIGLAPTKSKRAVELARLLTQRGTEQGSVPSTREDLESLPGVGRKTASVVLAEIFGKPELAVDTHVFRVGGRLGLHRAKNVLEAERAILELAQPKDVPKLHHWLILHGRRICVARKPRCGVCPVFDLCPSGNSSQSS